MPPNETMNNLIRTIGKGDPMQNFNDADYELDTRKYNREIGNNKQSSNFVNALKLCVTDAK